MDDKERLWCIIEYYGILKTVFNSESSIDIMLNRKKEILLKGSEKDIEDITTELNGIIQGDFS